MGLLFFGILYAGIFVFIIFIASSSSRKAYKINENISSKYKEEAFNLISRNEELKKERTNYKIRRFFAILCGIAFAATMIYIMTSGEWKLPLLIGLGVLILLIILMPKSGDKNSLFRTIIPSILSSYKSDLTYFHKGGFSSAEYREAGFESYDRFRSDDFIRGKVGNYDFELSEVKTERQYRDKDGHTHYSTIFHGVFARVPLDKEFGCFINVVNNKIKLFNKDKYISIDNEAFEKIYDVFTSDKIMAMRLLSPDVTTKMIDIYNETGMYFEFKIYNKVLYVRMHTGSLFQLNYSNPKKESLMIGRSLAIIDSVFKIFEVIVDEIERFDV